MIRQRGVKGPYPHNSGAVGKYKSIPTVVSGKIREKTPYPLRKPNKHKDNV